MFRKYTEWIDSKGQGPGPVKDVNLFDPEKQKAADARRLELNQWFKSDQPAMMNSR